MLQVISAIAVDTGTLFIINSMDKYPNQLTKYYPPETASLTFDTIEFFVRSQKTHNQLFRIQLLYQIESIRALEGRKLLLGNLLG